MLVASFRRYKLNAQWVFPNVECRPIGFLLRIPM